MIILSRVRTLEYLDDRNVDDEEKQDDVGKPRGDRLQENPQPVVDVDKAPMWKPEDPMAEPVEKRAHAAPPVSAEARSEMADRKVDKSAIWE